MQDFYFALSLKKIIKNCFQKLQRATTRLLYNKNNVGRKII